MVYEKPLPNPNADTKPFWEGCRNHQLKFQKCGSCGYVRNQPSVICPRCHSTDAEWITSAGQGEVYTFTVFHNAYRESFAGDVPYIVALIELTEGVRFLSNIVECPPQEVVCGMPVEVVWEDINEEFSLPKFRRRD